MTIDTASGLSTASAYPVLPAEDLARARTFYGETLGFPIEDMPGGQFVAKAGSGTRILVYSRARTKAEHTVMTFVVDDIKPVMTDLLSRGVKFEEYDMPGLKTVDGVAEIDGEFASWFVDSEGNIINIAQMK